jgi:hypothetical protein
MVQKFMLRSFFSKKASGSTSTAKRKIPDGAVSGPSKVSGKRKIPDGAVSGPSKVSGKRQEAIEGTFLSRSQNPPLPEPSTAPTDRQPESTGELYNRDRDTQNLT